VGEFRVPDGFENDGSCGVSVPEGCVGGSLRILERKALIGNALEVDFFPMDQPGNNNNNNNQSDFLSGSNKVLNNTVNNANTNHNSRKISRDFFEKKISAKFSDAGGQRSGAVKPIDLNGLDDAPLEPDDPNENQVFPRKLPAQPAQHDIDKQKHRWHSWLRSGH
jgi:hypothetical protein